MLHLPKLKIKRFSRIMRRRKYKSTAQPMSPALKPVRYSDLLAKMRRPAACRGKGGIRDPLVKTGALSDNGHSRGKSAKHLQTPGTQRAIPINKAAWGEWSCAPDQTGEGGEDVVAGKNESGKETV